VDGERARREAAMRAATPCRAAARRSRRIDLGGPAAEAASPKTGVNARHRGRAKIVAPCCL
ncbi:MAG: hypothetical protein ACLFU0_07370, partial [Alphaproteobacteria bacterium]